MQTQIYFIRHGEVHNPDGIIYGRLLHFGLSDKGKKEIEKTAEFLENKHIDTIYTSPLERSIQSAEIIQHKLHLPTLHISKDITETLTSYQGHKFKDLDLLQSEVYLKPLSPNDETIEQLATRMKNFAVQLIKKHTGEHIAVVSHGDSIMALKAAIKTGSFEFYQFKTDHYIQHAEVYQVTAEDTDDLSIKSVFVPVI